MGAALLGLAGAVFLWAAWRNGGLGHPEVRLDRWHHFYLGLGLGALGAWRRRPWVLCVGALVAADDAWQHLHHVTGSPDYRSPLHLLFARWLWPIPAVQRLTRWLDQLIA